MLIQSACFTVNYVVIVIWLIKICVTVEDMWLNNSGIQMKNNCFVLLYLWMYSYKWIYSNHGSDVYNSTARFIDWLGVPWCDWTIITHLYWHPAKSIQQTLRGQPHGLKYAIYIMDYNVYALILLLFVLYPRVSIRELNSVWMTCCLLISLSVISKLLTCWQWMIDVYYCHSLWELCPT